MTIEEISVCISLSWHMTTRADAFNLFSHLPFLGQFFRLHVLALAQEEDVPVSHMKLSSCEMDIDLKCHCSHMGREPNRTKKRVFKSFLVSRAMHQWLVSCPVCMCVAAVFTVSVVALRFHYHLLIFGGCVFVTWSQWISCNNHCLPVCLSLCCCFHFTIIIALQLTIISIIDSFSDYFLE